MRWLPALGSALLLVAVSACTTAVALQPPVAESGAVCIERDHLTNTGELCFRNEDGTIRLTGSEILRGSTMTIRGGSGDELSVTVDSDTDFSIDLAGQILERPLSATGVWIDGEPVNLVIDY